MRFDWELSEIMVDEIMKRHNIDPKKVNTKISNELTGIADEMVSDVMDGFANLDMNVEFEELIRDVKKVDR